MSEKRFGIKLLLFFFFFFKEECPDIVRPLVATYLFESDFLNTGQ